MKLYRFLFMGLFILLPVAKTYATDSAQDPDISVNPVTLLFPVTSLSSTSNPAEFIITNTGTAPLSLGSRSLSGVDAGEFILTATDCGASLAIGTNCGVKVKFTPTSKGTKSASLLIDYGSGKTLTAFMTNSTSPIVEAQRRLPAVLSNVAIPDNLTPGSNYTFTWTLEGYDAGYSTYAVLFDCTGIANGTCGDSYYDTTRFAESTPVNVTPGSAGNWTYSGVGTKLFDYSWDFTVPLTRTGGGPWATTPGTEIVVRFYQKNDNDATLNIPSVSLLIPGNQATTYYDTVGRRIVKRIVGP